MSRTPQSVAEALRRAYDSPESCPPPEMFLAEELAALDPETRASYESHAERCPACAAERELARAFDESADAMTADESEDVRHIVRWLERNAPGRKNDGAPGRLFRFPAAGLTRSPVFRMAAAAVLVLAVGFAVQTMRVGPPQLPDSAVDTVVRGGELAVVSPIGEIATPADAFVWQAVEGAVTYGVTLKAVDDTILWESTGSQPSARLPESVGAELHRAVTYSWKVDALDSEGLRVGGSGWVEFRVQPASIDD